MAGQEKKDGKGGFVFNLACVLAVAAVTWPPFKVLSVYGVLIAPLIVAFQVFIAYQNNTKAFWSPIRTHEIRVAASASCIVSAISYAVFFSETLASDPNYLPRNQHYGLALAWTSAALWTWEVYENKPSPALFFPVVMALGFVGASGFIPSIMERPFEENSSWLWIPALHAAVFDAGIYCVLTWQKTT